MSLKRSINLQSTYEEDKLSLPNQSIHIRKSFVEDYESDKDSVYSSSYLIFEKFTSKGFLITVRTP